MSNNVDLMWNMIFTRINGILEVMCPYKVMFLRDPKTPWINADIIRAINDRKKYIRMFRKTRNQYILEICKYLRNKCNSLIRNAKAAYVKQSLVRTADDPRKFWKSINNILKGPKSDVTAHEFIDSTTGEVISRDGICNYLNNYFANVGTANQANVNQKPIWTDTDPGYNFEIVTLKEVIDLVKEIDIGKDSCIDGLPTYILKEGLQCLAGQMQHIFNTSLEMCVFPREWAKGFINILPKGGNLKDPSNWRPITQTPLPAKILEKIVQKRFFTILKTSNYISKYQYVLCQDVLPNKLYLIY